MTIFCDLDGTLIDSTKRHIILLQNLLYRYHIELNLDDYFSYKFDGNSTKSFLLKAHLPHPLVGQISAEWQQHIEDEEYLSMDTIYPDVLPFLQSQSVQNDIVYVSARKNQQATMVALESYGLVGFAKKIYIVDPANAAQEKIRAIKSMATMWDYFVGDTEVDLECAQHLGITGLVLNRGFRSKAYWDKRRMFSFDNLYTLQAEIVDKREPVNNGIF